MIFHTVLLDVLNQVFSMGEKPDKQRLLFKYQFLGTLYCIFRTF